MGIFRRHGFEQATVIGRLEAGEAKAVVEA
jgi:hypothetical protein